MIQPLVQTFTKGLDSDSSPYVLDASTVASVTNMLFERGLLISRPPYSNYPTSIAGANARLIAVLNIAYSGGVYTVGFVRIGAVAPYTYKMYSFNLVSPNQFTVTEITPAGLAIDLGVPWAEDWAIVNGALLVTTVAGIMHWVIGAATYSIVGAATVNVPACLTGHGTRAVAAIGNTIYWSASGDATVWDPAVNPTAGNSTQADATNFVGLAVIRNALIAAHSYGFHIGVPTGTSQPVYDFKKIATERYSCYWNRTFTPIGDEIYYVGRSNVYVFNGVEFAEIGEGILKELLDAFNTQTYRGLFVPTYTFDARPLYILAPDSQGLSSAAQTPTFVYDIREKKWSRQVFTALAGDAIAPCVYSIWFQRNNSSQPQFNEVPALLRQVQPPTIHPWNAGLTALETTQGFTTGRMQVGDIDKEYTLIRMLVVMYTASPVTLTFTVSSLLDGTDSSVVKTRAFAAGWNRQWVDVIKPGQLFSVQMSAPAGHYLAFRQLVLQFGTEGAEVRNAN